MITEQILGDSLRQTDCSPLIARYGCYAWVHGMAAQLRTGEMFSRPRFEQVVAEAGKRLRYDGRPIVDSEITLNDPQAFAQMCFDALAPGRYKLWQVGTDSGWFKGERWYGGPQVEDYSYLALRWGRPNGYHFTYFDPRHSIAWDPHGGLWPLSPVGIGVVFYLAKEVV